jgi:hypothetical protein
LGKPGWYLRFVPKSNPWLKKRARIDIQPRFEIQYPMKNRGKDISIQHSLLTEMQKRGKNIENRVKTPYGKSQLRVPYTYLQQKTVT